MTLPVDTDSEDYRFYKTLHQDIQLVPDQWNSKYDMAFENGDIINATGNDSLANAVCIAILTIYNELNVELYDGFGCKVRENLKKNQSTLVKRTIENQSLEVLNSMRRIKKVNYLEVESDGNGYTIDFSVTSISDTNVTGGVELQ